MNPSPSVREDDAWLRGLRFWEFAFGSVLIATSVVIATTDNLTPAAKTAAVALLVCQVPAYALLGRRVIAAEDGHPLRYVYLLVIMSLFIPATFLVPSAAFGLFAIAPLCYMAVHPFAASFAVVILNAGPIISIMDGTKASGPDLIQGGAAIAVATMLSFTMGMWIYRIVRQSSERAELIRELDATRAELVEVSRHAGVLEERRRMAREIHDTLAQGFSSITMLLQAAEAESSGDSRYLRLARRAAQVNLDDARALVSGSLDIVRLPESLRNLAGSVGEELGIDVEFSTTGIQRRLEPHIEIALLRVGQEALANVRKHSGADRVDMRLEYATDGLSFRVSDTGTGFDAGAVHDGYGLPGIRERVAGLDGTVDITSTPMDGTAVSVTVPT